MNNLYNWVFHFNPYQNRWFAVKRENYGQLFSGGPDVLKSNEISTLVSIIKRTDGDKAKINKMLS